MPTQTPPRTQTRPRTARARTRTAVREVLDPAHVRTALRPPTPGPAPWRSGLPAALRCGTAVAVALAGTAALGHRELAGFAALGSLAVLYGRNDGHGRRARLVALVGAVLVAAISAVGLVVALGAPDAVALALVAVLAGGTTALLARVAAGPPGATIVVFAAGAGLAGPPDLHDVVVRGTAALAGAVLAWLVAMSTTVPPAVRPLLRRAHRDAPPPVPGRTPARLVPRDRPPLLAPALRVAAASALAAWAAEAVGFGHPAWAAVGATAALQGTTTGHVVVRALQRAGGTVVGALVAWPLLAAGLGFWWSVAVVVVLQVVTELVVGRHYGLAMLSITPMALLMTSLGASAVTGALAADRALDTAIGALVGVVVVLLAQAGHRGMPAPAH
ncbi:FUSC family protein [Cellulomonas sp. PhB143]|uniref:FUSC family protein n=1 Tax=Cellulomonas sp. PhB143 TaxID=2485186 RepID=UPI000F487123|nr:FUSC family protein [Cellulomonas sp. PhB143]ROS75317.1 fusaric acid resistance family protein [Cellulomonas sp. PhB143]